MKIAICSKDYKTISGHAGKARRWLVFSVGDGEALSQPEKVELAKDQVFHHFKDDTCPHPLDGIDVLITASAGDDFLTRMERRDVSVARTRENDPVRAVKAYLAGELPPPKPRPIGDLVCKLHHVVSSR